MIERTHTRTDALNLTNIWDNVTTANNQSYWCTAANRLQNTTGPWGTTTNYYDGVGNRTYDISTPSGGATTTRVFAYPAGSNRLSNVKIGTTTERTFVHDAAGNITSDTRSGTAYAYAYNKRNRLNTVKVATVLKSTYTYNGLEQVAIRVLSNMTPSGTTHFIYDRFGNLIAETAGGGATGATGTVREYIYLPETEIAPTMGSRTVVDRPVAVVNAVNTTPVIWQVHVDHLNRPIRMTDATKASVWDVVWAPWGSVYSISGAATLDARFPGQWYQLESGLHYNWHRHYDPTLGRYTQPDPLGFVDGPSVYGYAKGSPQRFVDRDGRFVFVMYFGWSAGAALADLALAGGAAWWWQNAISRPSGGSNVGINVQAMARPPGYWDGAEGAEEWGRRKQCGAREGRRKFHQIKQDDPGSRGDDEYYTNPETGDVVGPSGESAGNLND